MSCAKFLRALFFTEHLWATASESSYWQISVLGDRSIYVLSMLLVLTLPSDMTILNGNVAFLILLLSAKKRNSSFLKKASFSKVSIENVQSFHWMSHKSMPIAMYVI